ncbi:MAG: tyrosine-type recombinase/integrase [Gammaproteobacteria bacterium]|nr:tyrosine-type recombinase/integrase [Gammaproteobacteria bacterium]
MPTKRITDKTVAAAAPQQGRPREAIFDDLVTGLCLRVGARTRQWVVVYTLAGRKQWETLGKARTCQEDERHGMTVGEAREAAKKALVAAANGDDPRARPAEILPEHVRETFAAVKDDYIKFHAKPKLKPRTADSYRGELNRVAAKLGKKPITAISRRDVLDITDGFVKEGKGAQARLVYAILKSFFNWCVQRGILDASPIAGLKAPAKVPPRDRILTDDEIKAVWSAAGPLEYPFGPFVKLLLLTGQRETELAHMRWADIDGGVWTIPDTKRGTIHRVFLPKQALDILKPLPRFTGPYVFSGSAGKNPVSGFSRAKRRLDAFMEAADTTIAPWRFHDLRRTAASGMAALKVPPHVIEATLNHRSGIVSGIARVYNVHNYAVESAKGLAKWARHVECLTTNQKPGKVVPLKRVGVDLELTSTSQRK